MLRPTLRPCPGRPLEQLVAADAFGRRRWRRRRHRRAAIMAIPTATAPDAGGDHVARSRRDQPIRGATRSPPASTARRRWTRGARARRRRHDEREQMITGTTHVSANTWPERKNDAHAAIETPRRRSPTSSAIAKTARSGRTRQDAISQRATHVQADEVVRGPSVLSSGPPGKPHGLEREKHGVGQHPDQSGNPHATTRLARQLARKSARTGPPHAERPTTSGQEPRHGTPVRGRVLYDTRTETATGIPSKRFGPPWAASMPPPDDTDPEIANTPGRILLERYRIERPLGTGGMARSFSARRALHGRRSSGCVPMATTCAPAGDPQGSAAAEPGERPAHRRDPRCSSRR